MLDDQYESCLDCGEVFHTSEINSRAVCHYCQDPGHEEDEEDFLTGVTCNPDAPEECESCQ